MTDKYKPLNEKIQKSDSKVQEQDTFREKREKIQTITHHEDRITSGAMGWLYIYKRLYIIDYYSNMKILTRLTGIMTTNQGVGNPRLDGCVWRR